MRTLRHRAATLATAAVLPLALAACGGDDPADTGDTGTEEMTDDMTEEDMTEEDMTDEMTEDMSEEDMTDDMSESEG